jgi:hypothetical protein
VSSHPLSLSLSLSLPLPLPFLLHCVPPSSPCRAPPARPHPPVLAPAPRPAPPGGSPLRSAAPCAPRPRRLGPPCATPLPDGPPFLGGSRPSPAVVPSLAVVPPSGPRACPGGPRASPRPCAPRQPLRVPQRGSHAPGARSANPRTRP